ncbi:MAG: RNase adapter RapZ, partial [Clostridiales bacterium]
MLNYREEEKSSQIMADQKLEKPQINAVKPKKVQILLITGMSGAGKTQTVNALEDIGYFCVDNLPPNLFSKFIEGLLLAQNSISQVALVADIRNREFFNQLEDSLNQIKQLVS